MNHVCSLTLDTSSVTALAFESDVQSILLLFGFALQIAEPHYLRHGCSGAVRRV